MMQIRVKSFERKGVIPTLVWEVQTRPAPGFLWRKDIGYNNRRAANARAKWLKRFYQAWIKKNGPLNWEVDYDKVEDDE